jgi:hypothetical protein
MRQVRRAGEKAFVDYSGKKPHFCIRCTDHVVVEVIAADHDHRHDERGEVVGLGVGVAIERAERGGVLPARGSQRSFRSGTGRAG